MRTRRREQRDFLKPFSPLALPGSFLPEDPQQLLTIHKPTKASQTCDSCFLHTAVVVSQADGHVSLGISESELLQINPMKTENEEIGWRTISPV